MCVRLRKGFSMPKRSKQKFTNTSLTNLSAENTSYRVWDESEPGLCIIVYPLAKNNHPTKVFWCRYTIFKKIEIIDNQGKARFITTKKRKDYRIGSYGEYSIEQARIRAREIKASGINGDDLTKLEKAHKKNKEKLAKSMFLTFLDEVYQPHMAGKKCGIKIYKEIRSAFNCWHNKSLSDISPFAIRGWMNEKIKAGDGPVGMNRKLSYLKTALGYAVSQDLINENPFNRLVNDAGKPNWKRKELNNNEVRRLSDEELTQLLKALRQRDFKKRNPNKQIIPIHISHWRETGFADYLEPMVLLALNCGLRRNEIFMLKWGDVDFKTHTIKVQSTHAKSNKSREAPMTKIIEKVLTCWKTQHLDQSNDNDLVFRSNKRSKNGFVFDNITTSWQNVRETAKLPEFRFHDCRHHYASQLASDGISLYEIKEILGHSDIKITERYAKFMPGNLANKIRAKTEHYNEIYG